MSLEQPIQFAVQRPTLQLRKSAASPTQWDQFAHQCGASFRCSYRGTVAWQFEFHWLHRQHRFDLHLVTPTSVQKIGQCAVGVGRRKRVFSDGIQLLPAHQDLWNAAMTTVLEHLGPGNYVYGSEWSLESPRENRLGDIQNLAVSRVEPTSVAVIDFQRWADWDDYWKAISSNVRRNLKKAESAFPSPTVVQPRGLTKYRYHLQSLGMRRAMFRRKNVRRSTASMLVRSAVRLLSMDRYSQIACLVTDKIATAYYIGITYGENSYYLEGASGPGIGTTSWPLLMNMIEQAYRQSGGKGKFVMGSDDGSQAGVEAWEGLRRSREQCRATSFPTSVVHFSYAGVSAGRMPNPCANVRSLKAFAI